MQNLPICKLCQNTPANQTGSHILTSWLVASCLNDQGQTRDHEILFTIDSFNNRIPYYGRSVSPETIEETLGRELEDEEIKENVNPLVMDHFLCARCESRLQIVEDIFLNEVHRSKEFNTNESKYRIFGFTPTYLYKLFIISLFWRASVTCHGNFRLKSKFEKKLRVVLDSYLVDSHKDLKDKTKEDFSRLDSIPVVTIRSPEVDEPTTKSIILHPNYQAPYSAVINDYIFMIYEKVGHLNIIQQSNFGVPQIIDIKDLITTDQEGLLIGFLTLDQWNYIHGRIVELKVRDRIHELSLTFAECHRRITHSEPKPDFIHSMVQDYVYIDEPNGHKYTARSLLDFIRRTYRIE